MNKIKEKLGVDMGISGKVEERIIITMKERRKRKTEYGSKYEREKKGGIIQ
jgi:hypothetical protein